MIKTKKMSDDYYELYTDGACRGNPGQGGAGVILLNAAGETVIETGKYLGDCTNNIAEYEALILGLKESLKGKHTRLKIFLDSELLVKQLSGEYRVKNERLRELHSAAKVLLSCLEDYKIGYLPREKNQLADKLANKALNAALK